MESIRIPYKNDAFGNPLFAKIAWSKSSQGSKPLGEPLHENLNTITD